MKCTDFQTSSPDRAYIILVLCFKNLDNVGWKGNISSVLYMHTGLDVKKIRRQVNYLAIGGLAFVFSFRMAK
jgi:hypothetical protein